RAHQRRLAGVGVADQRHRGQVAAPGPAHLRAALDLRELVLELGDAVADAAPVELERALAGALAAHAAADPVAAATPLAQARCQVLEPGDLDLHPGLAGPGMALKDLEDDRGAIEHVHAE